MSSVKKGGNEVSKHKNPIYDFFKSTPKTHCFKE